MSDNDEDNDDQSNSSPKKGKKKYYPFGTPTHTSVPYSKFAHLNDPQTQDFAAHLASSEKAFEVVEPVVVRPKRTTKKTPSKSTTTPAEAENAAAAIPDTEGVEPCTKIACQMVLRAMADIQFRNEVERDEIEDEYERLLQELAATEQEIATADAKFVALNDIGSQLEMRANQLHEKVDTLQTLKDAQDSERNDINSKLMILQTDKNKRARQLDKAMKALSDAMWRKKKQEHMDNVDAGLSLAGSVISEKPIVQTDAATVASLGSIYKTSYNKLAGEYVRDQIEFPQTVKTLPAYTMEVLAKPAELAAMDKYAQKHYKTLKEHGVKSWEGMDGSLLTASIYSASSRGYGSEINAQSYDEYSQIRANRSMSSAISTAASSRVGNLLQSRNSTSASPGINDNINGNNSLMMLSQLLGRSREGSPTGGRSKYSSSSMRTSTSKVGKNQQKKVTTNQIRLAPLQPALNNPSSLSLPPSNMGTARSGDANLRAPNNYPGVGESGLDAQSFDGSAGGSYMDDGLGQGSAASVSGFSALSADTRPVQGGGSVSPQSLSMSLSMSALSTYNNSIEGDGSTLAEHARSLDPVFYKDAPRNNWGRKHAVGKLRKAEISWGMQSYQDPNKPTAEDEEEDLDTSASAASVGSRARQGSSLGLGSTQKRIATANSTRSATSSSSRTFKDPLQVPPGPATVKSRSLTVYHPDMRIFQDAVTLPKKKTVAPAY